MSEAALKYLTRGVGSSTFANLFVLNSLQPIAVYMCMVNWDFEFFIHFN